MERWPAPGCSRASPRRRSWPCRSRRSSSACWPRSATRSHPAIRCSAFRHRLAARPGAAARADARRRKLERLSRGSSPSAGGPRPTNAVGVSTHQREVHGDGHQQQHAGADEEDTTSPPSRHGARRARWPMPPLRTPPPNDDAFATPLGRSNGNLLEDLDDRLVSHHARPLNLRRAYRLRGNPSRAKQYARGARTDPPEITAFCAVREFLMRQRLTALRSSPTWLHGPRDSNSAGAQESVARRPPIGRRYAHQADSLRKDSGRSHSARRLRIPRALRSRRPSVQSARETLVARRRRRGVRLLFVQAPISRATRAIGWISTAGAADSAAARRRHRAPFA